MPAVSELRQPSGTAFAIRDALPWSDLSAVVRAAEGAGYSVLFLPEISGRDALVTSMMTPEHITENVGFLTRPTLDVEQIRAAAAWGDGAS